MTKKMILDLDIGVDDMMALMEAIALSEYELIGITNVFGNVATDISVKNALDLTEYFNVPDVEVYKGAEKPLTGKEVYEAPIFIHSIHGRNGLGNIEIPVSNREVKEERASEFIARKCDELGKDLVIVATGPLTNLAEVVENHPEALKKAHSISIMGGAVGVQGNVTQFAEANIHNDPEAAKKVLEESNANITLIPLDVTMRVRLSEEDVKDWSSLGPVGKDVSDIIKFYIEFYNNTSPDLGGCSLHDPLAVAVVADPSLIKTVAMEVAVELEGCSRGRTIGKVKSLRTPKNPINVAVDVQIDRFEKSLKENLIEVINKAQDR